MATLKISTQRARCQAHGACLKLAPEAFELDAERKVRMTDPDSVADDLLLRAAQSCPYRVITVVDGQTGEQIHPRVKK